MGGNALEKALTGVSLVVLTDKEGRAYSFSTATKANAKVLIENGKRTELIIKGILKAQRQFDSTIKGVEVEFQDNMFLPEVVAVLQGGTVTKDAGGNFMKYIPPVAGFKPELNSFNVDIYTEETDTSGITLRYAKLSLPNGKGEPIELGFEDDRFFSARYIIKTAPRAGEAPYVIEMVDELPRV
ncbi:MAG: hypothetical protein FWE29_04905 [Defluviitaleaceae bacterium]|nr:hypothetical protein [Defluviitaleaceae bacterium]